MRVLTTTQVQAKPPLLSICLATYNASHLLRVTLGAALPQVAVAGGRVELLVVDDASTDDTPAVIEEARKHGPLRYIRNDKNLGVNGNLVHGPSQHAKGEFIWVWNQHCLLYPGALERLLGALEQNLHLDVFYANFRCARYPEDFPKEAVGGYDGPIHYLSNPDLEDRHIIRWQDLLDARTCACTQSYAHIVRRVIWRNYWATHAVGESFRDALSSYPHTCMLVESVLNEPSYYIGSPLITIFNGAQSWGGTTTAAKVICLGVPDLLRYFKKHGVRPDLINDVRKTEAQIAKKVFIRVFRESHTNLFPTLIRYPFTMGWHVHAFRSVFSAFLETRCTIFSDICKTIHDILGRCGSYILRRRQ